MPLRLSFHLLASRQLGVSSRPLTSKALLFVRCREKALQCLNHLVTNALVHVPDCLEYLSRLHTPEVFKFCAIPQVRQPPTETPSRLSLSLHQRLVWEG